MSQDKKPLFPRESEIDAEAQSNLLKDVKQKLEIAESESEFELPNIKKKRFLTPMEPPPAKSLRPVSVYGPPPYLKPRNLLFVFILIVSLLGLFILYMLYGR